MLVTLVSVVFCIICVVLSAIVLMQEGNEQGLGSVGGSSSDTYWSKNKGRSAEGFLTKLTTACAVLFLVLAFVLNFI